MASVNVTVRTEQEDNIYSYDFKIGHKCFMLLFFFKKGMQKNTYASRRPGPEVIKLFFMLSLVEHLNAHKYKKYQVIRPYLGQDKPRMLFFPLINVKMTTMVGILTFVSKKNFMLS